MESKPYTIKFELIVSGETKKDIEDPEDYLTHISGKIFSESGKQMGFLRASKFEVEQVIEDNEGIIWSFDAISAEASGVVSAIFNTENEFSSNVLKLEEELEICFYRNILYIDLLVIYPKYRGLGLGKFLVKHLIGQFANNCALVAVSPRPVLYSPAIALANKGASTKTEPVRRIENPSPQSMKWINLYWKRLGFRRLNKKYMILPLEFGSPITGALSK